MSNSNPFAVAASPAGGLIQVAQSKEAQQIQAQLVVAKRYPRDQHAAFQRILEACKRRGLAEEATYLFSRGGTSITGASIRLLEVVAQQWGNFRSGITELDNEGGESRVEAFAWDLETNAYDSKTFTVRHERYTREGATKLTDPRDIYEHVANFAARRKRACMEAVIPRDVIDAAIEQCDATLKQGHTESLGDRVRKMVSAFSEFAVTVDMLERRLQHKLDAVNEQEMVILRKIYTSLKDGMGRREDFFNLTEGPKPAKFDKSDETVADAKAEAAAGLAPANRVDAPAPSAAATTPASAPAATTAPAAAAAPQTAAAKARAARKTAMTAPGQDPTPAPAPAPSAPAATQPVTPTPPAAAPAPAPAPEPTPAPPAPAPVAAPVAPATPAGDLFNGGAAPASVQESQALAARAYEAIAANKVTEEEVLHFLKSRKICPENIEQIVQLADDIVVDLIENIAPVAAQVRINRKFTGKK